MRGLSRWCHFREGRGAGGSAACLGHCSSPAAGTAREIHPPEPGLINHLNYSTASSFQDLSRSVFTQNRVENAPGPTFRVSSIWPLWGVSGGSDRQGCSVRGAPAPATCHIAGLMASDSSICASPRDERAICGGEGTGERDEQGHAGRRDVGCCSIPGTLLCPVEKTGPSPQKPTSESCWGASDGHQRALWGASWSCCARHAPSGCATARYRARSVPCQAGATSPALALPWLPSPPKPSASLSSAGCNPQCSSSVSQTPKPHHRPQNQHDRPQHHGSSPHGGSTAGSAPHQDAPEARDMTAGAGTWEPWGEPPSLVPGLLLALRPQKAGQVHQPAVS